MAFPLALRQESSPTGKCASWLKLTPGMASAKNPAMPEHLSAFDLVLTGDSALFAIVGLSLAVSVCAALLAALLGVPLGAALALSSFRGRDAAIVMLNAMMGLPPVVIGLVVYLVLSRAGPLGSWGLIFTPQAMVIAQTLLVTPIVAALARQTIEDLWLEYRDELTALEVGPLRRIATLVWDARFSLITALLAGFGRAAAEVGAVSIVGGNIDGFTRTMTTAIALETSKGDLPLAIGLGLVLIVIIVMINALVWALRRAAERLAG
jgi:tungstate transport system permease protein